MGPTKQPAAISDHDVHPFQPAAFFFSPRQTSRRLGALDPKYQSRRQKGFPSAHHPKRSLKQSSQQMAVPGGRNGLRDEDEEMAEHAEAFAGASDDEDVPPHLRALANAAQTGDVAALVAALDNHDGSIDVPVEDGDTLLHLACLYGHLPCVQLLLERGASLECKDEEGAIPLHDACAGGFTEMVQYILNFAASKDGCVARMLDTVDSEGDTPLHHAARGEHLDVVKLLIEAGASPKKENTYGQTPADMADQDTEVRTLLTAKQIEASTHMSGN